MLKSQEPNSLTFRGVLYDTAFALVRFPGQKRIRRFVAPSVETDGLLFDGLKISSWDSTLPENMTVAAESTSHDDYVSRIEGIVSSLRQRGGKTVICRQICGTFRHFDPETMAKEYFSRFPDMFCFLFYHPVTGFWMGASPELLLEIDRKGIGHTRALAGTRNIDDDKPWSAKNMAEHRIVVEDICRRIGNTNKGYYTVVSPTGTLGYGAIEHLATDIVIVPAIGPTSMSAIVRAIHPTAAICGYPADIAKAEIRATEQLPRHFYGGTLITPHLAYVILRCVHFDKQGWCVYTGSGITPDSDPESEWEETRAKAESLIEILNRY